MGSKGQEAGESKSKRRRGRGISGSDLVVGIGTVVVAGVASQLFSKLRRRNLSDTRIGKNSLDTGTNGDGQANSLLQSKGVSNGEDNTSEEAISTVAKGRNITLDESLFLGEKTSSLETEKLSGANTSTNFPDDDSNLAACQVAADRECPENTGNETSTDEFSDPLYASSKEIDFQPTTALSELVNNALLDSKHDNPSKTDILIKAKALQDGIADVISRAFEDFGRGDLSEGELVPKLKLRVTWENTSESDYEETDVETNANSTQSTQFADGWRVSTDCEPSVNTSPIEDLQFVSSETEADAQVSSITPAPAYQDDFSSESPYSPSSSPANDSKGAASELSPVQERPAEEAPTLAPSIETIRSPFLPEIDESTVVGDCLSSEFSSAFRSDAVLSDEIQEESLEEVNYANRGQTHRSDTVSSNEIQDEFFEEEVNHVNGENTHRSDTVLSHEIQEESLEEEVNYANRGKTHRSDTVSSNEIQDEFLEEEVSYANGENTNRSDTVLSDEIQEESLEEEVNYANREKTHRSDTVLSNENQDEFLEEKVNYANGENTHRSDTVLSDEIQEESLEEEVNYVSREKTHCSDTVLSEEIQEGSPEEEVNYGNREKTHRSDTVLSEEIQEESLEEEVNYANREKTHRPDTVFSEEIQEESLEEEVNYANRENTHRPDTVLSDEIQEESLEEEVNYANRENTHCPDTVLSDEIQEESLEEDVNYANREKTLLDIVPEVREDETDAAVGCGNGAIDETVAAISAIGNETTEESETISPDAADLAADNEKAVTVTVSAVLPSRTDDCPTEITALTDVGESIRETAIAEKDAAPVTVVLPRTPSKVTNVTKVVSEDSTGCTIKAIGMATNMDFTAPASTTKGSKQESLKQRMPVELLGVAVFITLVAVIVLAIHERFKASTVSL